MFEWRLHKKSRIPHTEVWGLFRLNLLKANFEEYSNPTNGRWWIVQVRPFSHSDDGNSNFARILRKYPNRSQLLGVGGWT